MTPGSPAAAARDTAHGSGVAAHAGGWLRDWESMMDAYLPGRGDLLMAGLQAVEAVLGRPPSAVLDLGGGPGSTARKLLRRWPDCRVTVLDRARTMAGRRSAEFVAGVRWHRSAAWDAGYAGS